MIRQGPAQTNYVLSAITLACHAMQKLRTVNAITSTARRFIKMIFCVVYLHSYTAFPGASHLRPQRRQVHDLDEPLEGLLAMNSSEAVENLSGKFKVG